MDGKDLYGAVRIINQGFENSPRVNYYQDFTHGEIGKFIANVVKDQTDHYGKNETLKAIVDCLAAGTALDVLAEMRARLDMAMVIKMQKALNEQRAEIVGLSKPKKEHNND